MLNRIILGGKLYPVTLKRGGRSLRIRISPTGEILLTVPYGVSQREAERFVAANEASLLRGLERVSRTPLCTYPAAEEGAVLPYCGRKLVLHFTEGRGASVTEETLTLGCDMTAEGRKHSLDRWYLAEAKRVLIPLTAAVFARCFGDGSIPPPAEVRVRAMTSRWGTCQPKTRVILLNSRLLGATPEEAEYVIVHELAHLRFADHGAGFRALMDERLPDHRRRKASLNGKNT